MFHTKRFAAIRLPKIISRDCILVSSFTSLTLLAEVDIRSLTKFRAYNNCHWALQKSPFFIPHHLLWKVVLMILLLCLFVCLFIIWLWIWAVPNSTEASPLNLQIVHFQDHGQRRGKNMAGMTGIAADLYLDFVVCDTPAWYWLFLSTSLLRTFLSTFLFSFILSSFSLFFLFYLSL